MPLSIQDHGRSIATRFTRASGTYHDLATVQGIVAGTLLRFATPGLTPARILELGCGTGLMTALLFERFPAAVVDAVDISTGMLEEVNKRLGGSKRLHLVHADVAAFRCGRPYPLVVSSASLHWVRPLRAALAGLRNFVEPGGELLVSLMLDGTLAELQSARRVAAPGKAPRGRLPRADEVLRYLGSAGLRVLSSAEQTLRETHPSASEFLRSLRLRGLTGGDVSTSAVPLTRGEMRRLVSEYDARCRSGEAGVYSSYQILYVKARA